MEAFDSLQNIWASQQPGGLKNPPDYKKLRSSKFKIIQEQKMGALTLTGTAVFITILAFTIQFQHWYTYLALVFIILICLLQSLLMVMHYRKCAAIDDSLAPKQYLQQWENYQAFLLRQLSWNTPVYYLLLNLAMGLYFIEILYGRPMVATLIFLSAYIAWMVFAYFYIGKKKKKKAIARLENIIDELKGLEEQFS